MIWKVATRINWIERAWIDGLAMPDSKRIAIPNPRFRATYRLNMSEIISTSVSAAAIFSAEDILGAPPKRKDMMIVDGRW